MNAPEVYEDIKHNLHKLTSSDIHPVVAAYRDAKVLRDQVNAISQDITDRDANDGWVIYLNPFNARQKAMDRLAEVRLAMILAEMKYQRLVDDEAQLAREFEDDRDTWRSALHC